MKNNFFKNFVLTLLLTNVLSFNLLGQKSCDNNPEITFIAGDCIRQNEKTNIIVYVYDAALKYDNSTKILKIFQDNKIISEKSFTQTNEGFYYDLFDIIPSGDMRLDAELHYVDQSCYVHAAKLIKTMPEYTLINKDIRCFGQNNGEIELQYKPSEGLSLLWENGSRKNSVTDLSPGTYKLTVENNNGCSVEQKVSIKEPAPLSVQASLFAVASNQSETHYIKAKVTGGRYPYKYNWNNSGYTLTDYMICDDADTHVLHVTDSDGCAVSDQFQFNKEEVIAFEPKDTRLVAEAVTADNQYRFNLMKALNPEHGDADGDRNEGSVFDVKFFDGQEEIADPENFIAPKNTTVNTKIKDATGLEKSTELILSTGFFLLQNNGSTACDYSSPIKLVATDLESKPLKSGGTFKVLERGSLVDYSSNVLSYNAVENAYYWNPGFKPQSYTSPLRYILYYINGVDTLQSQLNVVSPSGSIDVLTDNVCGNNGLVQVLCSPKDGLLSGSGLITTSISQPNSDQIIYFIDPKKLTPNSRNSYNYSIPQSTGTQSGLRCAAELYDTLDVLLYPSIKINQNGEQVCKDDGLGLSASAVPTSGTNLDLKYQWYSFNNKVRIPIVNARSTSLSIQNVKTTTDYIVEVTQSNGCKASDTTRVTIFSVPKVSSKILSDTTCYGVSAAEVSVSLDGVTDLIGYTFEWTGKSTGTIRNGNYQTNLPADSFLITTTTPPLNPAGLQCKIVDTIVVQSFPPLNIDCSPKDTVTQCFGSLNINRKVSVSPHAVKPLSYSLVSKNGPFQSSDTFTGLGVGNDPLILSKDFKVYVKDGRGCLDSCGFTIRQPEIIKTSISKSDLHCYHDGSGSVTVQIAGGTPPYRYTWNNGSVDGPTMNNSHTINGLAAGTYSVTVQDKNNCQTIASVVVGEPQKIKPVINQKDICLDSTGFISVSATGGSGNYTYLWSLIDNGTTQATNANLIGNPSDASLTFDAWNLNPGKVKIGVIVTDDKNCYTQSDTLITLHACFDLALRKRVVLPSKKYYAGDTVTFTIEVFNQGTIVAQDIKVNDVFDSNLHFSLGDNVASWTGNNHDWTLEADGTVSTYINQLGAGQKTTLKIALKIDDHVSSNANVINWSRIIESKSVIVLGNTKRIRMNPIDEDDLSTHLDISNPPSEKDDDICDDANIKYFPQECTKVDNPSDEDKMDFAVVQICQLDGKVVNQKVCIPESIRLAGYPINTPAFKAGLDPDGNGDGIADGDAGYLIASLHPTYIDALNNTNIIQGKIVFKSGDGSKSTTVGKLLPNGDMEVFTNQHIEIYARLVSLSNCVGVSTAYFDFSPQFSINEHPSDVKAIIGQNDVCLNVVVDPSFGAPYRLQWQELINNNYVDIPNETKNNYCIDSILIEDDKRKFRVRINATVDASQTCSVVTSAAAFEIDDKPKYVCQDLVNVSLDEHCQALITPAMVMQDDRFESRVLIKIVDSKGRPVPNPVTSEYIGQTLTVSAIDKITGNSCWSMIFIEDKLPPVIECPDDYTVSCANTSFTPPVPDFQDACDPNATLALISDIFNDLGCNNPDGIIGVRTITYVAKDKYGNTSKPCTFNVYFRSTDLSQLTWPANVTLSCRQEPDYPSWDLNSNYYPDVTETGFPKISGFDLAHYVNGALLSDNYCHINVSFTDEQINTCGNTFKVIRSWTVLNWCDGDVRRHTQLIDIKDNEGPEVSCPISNSFVLYTKPYTCTADFTVPAPVIKAECNSTTWTIAYELKDDHGLPTGVYINDNVEIAGNGYIIKDLPTGITNLRYSVVDACDNLTYCYTQVKVVDNVKPVPVCDEHTVVSITESGWARLFAKSIDDGSHDNCSSVRFGIRRMIPGCGAPSGEVVATYQDKVYYSFVDYCCSDLSITNHQIELLVIDESGNMNTCMTFVELQQKIIPKINCPAEISVDCETPFTPQALNSFATFTAPCPIYRLEYVDDIKESSCGEKTIVRSWNVKENSTNKIVNSCKQNILVRNLTPFDLSTVQFPESKLLVNQCNGGANDFLPSNPLTGGYPTWQSIGCSQVAASYKDQIFNDVEDACFKIIRHWTVIDWCTYDDKKPTTILNRQQVIKVIDTEKPVAVCKHLEVELTEGCSKSVTIIGDANDSCTKADDMKYQHSLNGEPYVNSRIFTRNLELGTHYLTWIVQDRCDNKDTCIQVIVVKDTKKPSPYCITEIATVLMPSSLSVPLWARKFDHGAYDNCSGALRFTFGSNRPVDFNRKHYYKLVGNKSVEASEADYLAGKAELWDPAENSSSLIFDCDDLGLKVLTIYVWDKTGNSDFCTVRVKIQDNSNNCAGSKPVIANGDIHTLNHLPIDNVETHIIDDLSNEFAVAWTNQAGTYKYDRMLDNVPYRIEPFKEGDYLNGVSTLDIVLIQRHILGIEPIADARLMLAADINGDRRVTASDLTELRKLILGVTQALPGKRSWSFILDDGNTTNAESMKNFATLTAKKDHVYTNNFIGLKIGDVNLSADATANNTKVVTRTEPKYIHVYKAEKLNDNDYKISFRSNTDGYISGLQLKLYIQDAITIKSIIPGLLNIQTDNFNILEMSGKPTLKISWNQSTAERIPVDGVLFDIVVTGSDPENIKNWLISAYGNDNEWIDEHITDHHVELRFENEQHSENENLIVYQNLPNPFSESTNIRYYIKESDNVDINVTDVEGRWIYGTRVHAQEGINSFEFNKNILNQKTGMMLVTFRTSKQTKTIKMLRTE